MKKQLPIVLLFLFSFLSTKQINAALPNGTPAADWTLTDLNGNTHTLSDYLNAGKHVILDFSATWCGPCWSYHQGGTLETLYDLYGPNGTDQIMVFMIESDLSTNTNCLYGPSGCVGGTQGNWVAGTPYPIIDLTSSQVAQDYQITYYPTLYGVSANGNTVWEVGQASVGSWENWLFNSFELQGNGVITDATCPAAGQIEQSPTGGYGSLDFEWNTGESSQDIYGLDGGTYICTITDNNNYFFEAIYDVNGPSTGQTFEIAIIDSEDVGCFGEWTGSITADAVGGNGGTQYSWSDGSSGETISNIPAGYYSVTATDAAGCELVTSYTIEEPDLLDTQTFPVNESCGNGNGSVTFATFGGTYPYNYDVDGIGFNTSGIFSSLSSGTYYYSITDANDCYISGEFVIISVGGPDAEASADDDLTCSVTEVTVSGEGSSEGDNISYLWTTTDGNIVSGETEIDAIVNMAGTYTLIVTNDDDGCSQSVTVEVTGDQIAPVSMSIANDPITCTTTTVVVDGAGSSEGDDYTYEWTTSDGNIVSGADELLAEVDAGGTYTLIVTNTLNGCTMESSVVVNEDIEGPAITVTGAELTCTITEVEICATVDAGLTVTWELPGGDVEANCVIVSTAGMFTAKVTGGNGCETTADAEVTISDDLPQVTAEPNEDITCTIEEVTLEASLEGDADDFDIIWTNAAGDVITIDELTIIVTNSGDYSLSVTNKTSGCETEIIYQVDEIIDTPISSYDFDQSEGELSLSSTSLGSPTSFSWDFGNGMTSTEENPVVNLGETGLYNICLTIVNDCGEDTSCNEVQYVSLLVASTEVQDALCAGDINGSIELTVSGGLPDYTISWTGPNGFESTDASLSDLAPGEYQLSLSDAFGNVINETYTVAEPAELVATGTTVDISCFGNNNGSIDLAIEGGNGDYELNWSNGGTDISLTDLSPGVYSVDVIDKNGCSTSETYTINEPAEIAMNTVDVTDTPKDQAEGTIKIDVIGGTGELDYNWSNGMKGNSIEGLEEGEYTVEVIDENGCSMVFGPFSVNSVSAVGDLAAVDKFKVYPNPTRGDVAVSIELNKVIDAKLNVTNIYGTTLQTFKIDSKSINTRLDMNNFAAGMYFINITSNEGVATKKVLLIK